MLRSKREKFCNYLQYQEIKLINTENLRESHNYQKSLFVIDKKLIESNSNLTLMNVQSKFYRKDVLNNTI